MQRIECKRIVFEQTLNKVTGIVCDLRTYSGLIIIEAPCAGQKHSALGRKMSVMMPSAAEVEYMYAHANDDRGPDVIAGTTATFTLATIAVILRLIARRISKSVLRADDWTILAAWVRIGPYEPETKLLTTLSSSLASVNWR